MGVGGWLVIDYLFPGVEYVLLIILCFLGGMGLTVFFLGPIILDEEKTATIQDPDNSPAMIPEKANSQYMTPTQIEYFTRSYHWTYGGYSPTYVLKIPESLYQYYRNQPHNRNYVKYAISEKDRYILRDLVSDFKENTDSKTEAAHQVVAFVQSIPYSKDYISTGYNEYPRYPIETLVDGSGDCEDTAILTAALLKEMSYDVVLLSPPGHMAIGITCPACKGRPITIDNKKYYYLETTAEGWEVGQLPPEYQNDQVRYYRI
jgi:predicted transglutaminase-like cysteine proteinase